eukprot:TRINITY_DN109533_c0_g1_i1.p1 TRINITY_DN109533_c0_g1~~TRINITY_DN109533_c0_g1_i1.p1  ORF type:complete len:360 (+),score=79.22 TRINITY_DN109533_c0_g1_i1:92-1171(+)
MSTTTQFLELVAARLSETEIKLIDENNEWHQGIESNQLIGSKGTARSRSTSAGSSIVTSSPGGISSNLATSPEKSPGAVAAEADQAITFPPPGIPQIPGSADDSTGVFRCGLGPVASFCAPPGLHLMTAPVDVPALGCFNLSTSTSSNSSSASVLGAEINQPVPVSLADSLFCKSLARSCPISAPPGLGQPLEVCQEPESLGSSVSSVMKVASAAAVRPPPPPPMPPTLPAAALMPRMEPALPPPPPPPVQPPALLSSIPMPCDVAPPPNYVPSIGIRGPELRISEAFSPLVGSAECPTQGSVNHRFGGCKPCAFFHTKGCAGGVACSFCHLCPAGEKKRRQKDKHQNARLRRVVTFGA